MSLLALHHATLSTQALGSADRELLDFIEGENLFPKYQLLDAAYIVPGEKGVLRESVVVSLTNFRLFLKSLQYADTLWVPYGVIDTIESKSSTIHLHCKDARVISVDLGSRNAHSSARASETSGVVVEWFLRKLRAIFAENARNNLFAIQYKRSIDNNELLSSTLDGWTVYDTRSYFAKLLARQPVVDLYRPNFHNEEELVATGPAWVLSSVNQDYALIPTYPEYLVLPYSQSSANDLREVVKFRLRGRIPVLTWMHPHKPITISRCSQPGVGLSLSKCPEDQELLEMIRRTNPLNQTLYIIDARPRINAVGNAIGPKQGGYEYNYQHCQVEFSNIANIHSMRASQRSLCHLITKSYDRSWEDSDWFTLLAGTQWLHHLQSVLLGATKIASLVTHENASVVVHCSDGWDRTAQLVSLAQILLDPFFRSLEGIQVLIEKDWLSFGHKFHSRSVSDHYLSKSNSENSPILVQFLDCLWQIMRQFPQAFEYNEKCLMRMADAVYDQRFGSFLEDSEKDRKPLKTITLSLWTVMNSPQERSHYLNPDYRATSAVLFPKTRLRSLSLWENYWARWDPY